MKKWLCICLTLFLLFVVSCTAPSLPTTSLSTTQTTSMTTSTTASPTKMDLLNVAVEYQAKIEALLETDEPRESTATSRVNPRAIRSLGVVLPFDPERLIPRSAFEEVYAVQIDNANHVYLEDHLLFYKEALDFIVEALANAETNEAVVIVMVEWQPSMIVPATVSLTADQSVLIRIEATEVDFTISTAVKFGYDGDDFYIRKFAQYDSSDNYDYFEFLEHHSIVSILYTEEEYYYQYVNQDDDTLFLYHRQGDGYLLRWYNPTTMLRTTLTRGIEGEMDYIELFCQKGIVFEFRNDLASSDAYVAWQLLEADGWDAAYMIDSGGPYHGVYLDGTKLPIEARQYNINMNPSSANVRMDMYLPKESLTDEILSLEPFGLSFRHPEITLEWMQATLDGVWAESALYQTYRGVDFTSDDIAAKFLPVIDADLLPNN
jgi:hypothetical protein